MSMICNQIFFREVNRHRSVCCCRYDLPQGLGPHITHGKYAGDAGSGGFISRHITGSIQFQLTLYQFRIGLPSNADEDTVAGFFGNSAEDVRAWLDEFGLEVSSTHTGPEELTPDRIKDTIAYHKTIGNKNIIIPGIWYNTKEELDAFCAALAAGLSRLSRIRR